MDFEEWLKKHEREVFKRNQGCFDKAYIFGAKNGFKAGQQSKQAEIDALKAKVDDLAKWAESHIKDYNSSESESEHDRGWFNAACQVFKTLKENKNDT